MKKGRKRFYVCIFSLIFVMIWTQHSWNGMIYAFSNQDQNVIVSVNYNEDHTEATITFEPKNEAETIEQIVDLDQDSTPLMDQKKQVSENGTYHFEVTYVKKNKDKQENLQMTNTEDVQETENVTVDVQVVNIQKKAIVSKQLLGDPVIATDLGAIFRTGDILVNNANASQSVNVNPRIEGNTMILYDAQPGGGIPTSYWKVYGPWYETETKVTSKEEVSFASNWTLKYNLKLPQLSNKQAANSTLMIDFPNGDGSVSLAGLNAGEIGPYNQALLTFWDNNAVSAVYESKVIAASGHFTQEREITVTCRFNEATNSSTFSISTFGSTKSYEYNLNTIGRTGKISLGNYASWGYKNQTDSGRSQYLTSPVYMKFTSFAYDNFNPVFEKLEWFDHNGNALDDTSDIKPNDILTVKVTVKNDHVSDEYLPAKIFLSDNETLAHTIGIAAEQDLIDGSPVTLSKNSQTVEFHVKVKDTIGEISLGLMMEDDFFHTKQYKQLVSKINIGQIFVNQSPQYTIVEPQRNQLTGEIIKDVSTGSMIFQPAKNQTLLNQDSYVKVDVTMLNPRVNEPMDLELNMDSTQALGLNLDAIYEFQHYGMGDISVDEFKAFLKGNKSLTFPMEISATAGFSCILPVKQTSSGAPFNTGAQVFHYTATGTIIPKGETQAVSGTWEKTTVVKDAIIDVDTQLDTQNIDLQREQVFDLRNPGEQSEFLKFSAVQENSGASITDMKYVLLEHDPASKELWKYFDISDEMDFSGIVPSFSDDGKQMKLKVTYNSALMIDGELHWTRIGYDENQTFRTKTKEITMTINGGLIVPVAYLQIPTKIELHDGGGIDQEHAGVKSTIGLIPNVETKHQFQIQVDNNFELKNSNQQSYQVRLYDDRGTAIESVGNKAAIGTLDNSKREKIIWFNLTKDPSRIGEIASYYHNTIQFHIRMNE